MPSPLHEPSPETLLVSEAALTPFTPGEYVIAIDGMDHPSVTLGNSIFPCLCAAVLPGSRAAARLGVPGGQAAWLSRVGDSVGLTVGQAGGHVLFTIYRPQAYAEAGIRLEIRRVAHDRPASAAPTATPPSFGPSGGRPGHVPAPTTAPAPVAAPSPAFETKAEPAAPGTMPTAGDDAPTPPPGPAPSSARDAAAPARPVAQTSPPPADGQTTPVPGLPAPHAGPAASMPDPEAASETPRGAQAPAPAPEPTPTPRLGGHLQGEGDVSFAPGQEAGRPGSGRRLEAVALYIEGVALKDLQYAVIGPDGRPLPWVRPPLFSGSRGTGAPALGFAARLGGEAAERYSIAYRGSFIAAGPAASARDGEFLRSPLPDDPLESLTVFLEPRLAS